MKQIKIILNNGLEENIIDEDDTDLDMYISNLSKIFLSSNISILTAQTRDVKTRIIVKPSEVSCIKIFEEKLEKDETITD